MFSIRRGRCGIKAIGSLIDGLASLRHLLRVAPYEETFRSGSERLGVNEIFKHMEVTVPVLVIAIEVRVVSC